MEKRDRKNDGAEEEDQLKVTDRRMFTADGQPRSALPDEEEPAGGSTGAEAAEPKTREPEFERRPVEEPEGCDFTMLINAMAEPVLLFLGEMPRPGAEKPDVDLERARIQIDMLDLLRVKCRGNLTPEEEGLLDRILYQLRMLYVSRANQPES